MEKEPCKKAKEVKTIGELGLSRQAENLVRGMKPEDLILSVRNFEIYKCTSHNDWDKRQIAYLIDEIESVLRYRGFLRDDLTESLTPESRFVKRYVIELNLMKGRTDKCMPFYRSNEIYETYAFTDYRLEKILNLLEDKLTKKQFRAVKSDIYHSSPRRGAIVREAKKALADNRDEICNELRRIFA